jgi:phosphotriesterase-related protein
MTRDLQHNPTFEEARRGPADTPKVRTITGDMDPAALSLTAMHEHVLLFEDDSFLADELRAFREAGGRSLVELTTVGLVSIDQRSDHACRLARLAQTSDVRIIAGTGFYKEPRLPSLVGDWSVDQWADHMVREIRDGIGGTAFRAGIIGEVGTSNYRLFATEEKVLRAAARAHLVTGASITTHTGRTTMAHEQLDIFESEGVDLRRVVIGHLDVQPRLRVLLGSYKGIANRGAYHAFDTVGKEGFFELELDPAYGQKFPYDPERAEIIAEIASQGYLRQVVISCDVDKPELTARCGGYARLLSFRWDLMAVGLAPEAIATILVANPQAVLSF